MLYIQIYDTLGRNIGSKEYDYNNDVRDLANKIIQAPDRLYGYGDMYGRVYVLEKFFYKKNNSSEIIENTWFEKVTIYRTINNTALPKGDRVKAIDTRLVQAKTTANLAGKNFENLSTGTEQILLYRVIPNLVALVAGNPSMSGMFSQIVKTISVSTEQWKDGYKQKLIDLEAEVGNLIILRNELAGEYETINTLDNVEKKENYTTTAGTETNTNRNAQIKNTNTNTNLFYIILAVALFAIWRKKRKKRQ